MRASIQLFAITPQFLIFNCITGILAVIFNITEIYLLHKSWKRVTHFEVILLNLAVADTMTGLISLSLTGACTYMNATNTKDSFLLSCIGLLTIVPVMTSLFFVISIGLERLRAIKSPLKFRYKNSSRKPTMRCVIASWTLTITVTTVLVVLGVLEMKGVISTRVILSKKLPLAIGIAMTSGMSLIILLYAGILNLLLRRSSWLFKYDPDAPKNTLLAAIHKELSTVILCLLVVVACLTCNIPITVSMFYSRVQAIDAIFITLNSVTNPLIYFFRGYAERFCNKQPIKFVSTEAKGQSKNKVSSKDFNGSAVI